MKKRSFFLTITLTVLIALGIFGVLYDGSFSHPTASAQETSTQSAITTLNEQTGFLADEMNTIEIVDVYGPSVVAINVEVRGERMNPFENIPENQLPPMFRDLIPQFQQGPEQLQQGSGSGFVVDEAGQILTNYHVVESALENGGVNLKDSASITVTFPDKPGEEFPVKVVGANALYDLALLELENPDDLPEGVKAIPIADSDSLKVGQKTVAIGNPFGFESTVTTGIVSGVGRSLQGIGQVDIPLVQTDAAINPGNSGGPLLNSKGELIGINTAIIPSVSATGQRGSLGIGFAVPSNLLRDNLAALQEGGFNDIASRPRLGIQIQDLANYPSEVRNRLQLPDEGVAVIAVENGSAAQDAGLQGSSFDISINGQTIPVPGDIIISADGQTVNSASQLQNIVFAKGEGDDVELEILRDGKPINVTVTLRSVETNN